MLHELSLPGRRKSRRASYSDAPTIVCVEELEQRVTPSVSWGDVIGSYDGVVAHSNINAPVQAPGNYSAGIYTGLEWQCVEYVQRFFWQVDQRNLYSLAHINAYQFFGSASTLGLTPFQNGGNVAPQPGDILCLGGGPQGLGHVAIVRAVDASQVEIIQQNGVNTAADNDFALNMTVANGHYTVSAAQLSGSLYVQGWLHMPTQATSTSTYISSSAYTANLGQSLTFSAWVYPASGNTAPSGSITWTSNGSYIGTTYLSSGYGYAYTSFVTSISTAGSNTIKATYSGSGGFQSSTASLSEFVNAVQVQTSTYIASNSYTANVGQSLTFSAWVYPASGNTAPSGSITWTSNGSYIGTTYLSSGYGYAYTSFVTSITTAGSNTIKATYSGSGGFQSSTASLSEFVNAVSKPTMPILIGPSGTVYTYSPTFSWYPASNAVWYRLYVWNSSTGQVVIDTWTQWTWYPSNASYLSGSYGFMVQAYGSGIYSDWSTPLYFRIA
jgi:hypothetical protein